MIFKALKTKSTKEFIGDIIGNDLFTGSIPKLFPITFDLDKFKEIGGFSKESLDDLYVVLVKLEEYDIK